MIRAAGLPPSLALAVAVVVELGGGLLLVSGLRTRTAASALALFSLVTALTFAAFADQNQMIHFLKNVMMAGGLLQIVAFGAGALSIDNLRAKGGEVPATCGWPANRRRPRAEETCHDFFLVQDLETKRPIIHRTSGRAHGVTARLAGHDLVKSNRSSSSTSWTPAGASLPVSDCIRIRGSRR